MVMHRAESLPLPFKQKDIAWIVWINNNWFKLENYVISIRIVRKTIQLFAFMLNNSRIQLLITCWI